MSLPKSKSEYGYSREELKAICKERKIPYTKFCKAFGINTCAVENGECRFYECDVERALYILKSKDGINHEWD